jgi:hypothetical protein
VTGREASEDALRRAGSARLKPWKLPPEYHCPLIGACLYVKAL